MQHGSLLISLSSCLLISFLSSALGPPHLPHSSISCQLFDHAKRSMLPGRSLYSTVPHPHIYPENSLPFKGLLSVALWGGSHLPSKCPLPASSNACYLYVFYFYMVFITDCTVWSTSITLSSFLLRSVQKDSNFLSVLLTEQTSGLVMTSETDTTGIHSTIICYRYKTGKLLRWYLLCQAKKLSTSAWQLQSGKGKLKF